MRQALPLCLAAALSLLVHGLAVGLLRLLWLLHLLQLPDVPPHALLAYGNSSVDGLAVDVVALDSGTLRPGNTNTPGGDDAPEPVDDLPDRQPVPAPPADEAPLLGQTADSVEEPELTRPSPLPAASAVVRNETKLPGAPGGSRLAPGTPSAGGTAGSSEANAIGSSKPTYPREAHLRQLEGRVVLLLRISAEGKVTEAQVHKSSGHAILDQSALNFAWTMKFTPARENGQAVAVRALYPVSYSLSSR